MTSPDLRATTLLKRSRSGDRVATSELLPLVYDELRSLAAGYMKRERSGHTLQPTALVHEVYLKLIRETDSDWEDRAHFLRVAARAMRQVLIHHARRAGARKRGGGALRVTLRGVPAAADGCIDLLEIEEALEKLERLDERKASVVEMRFFGGLSHAEIAAVLGVSSKTVEADWYMARAWLRAALSAGGA